MAELIMNLSQDKCPWFNTHNYTWQDDNEHKRSGSVRGQSCLLDKKEFNLLPESMQNGMSVSWSCLLFYLYSLLAKI